MNNVENLDVVGKIKELSGMTKDQIMKLLEYADKMPSPDGFAEYYESKIWPKVRTVGKSLIVGGSVAQIISGVGAVGGIATLVARKTKKGQKFEEYIFDKLHVSLEYTLGRLIGVSALYLSNGKDFQKTIADLKSTVVSNPLPKIRVDFKRLDAARIVAAAVALADAIIGVIYLAAIGSTVTVAVPAVVTAGVGTVAAPVTAPVGAGAGATVGLIKAAANVAIAQAILIGAMSKAVVVGAENPQGDGLLEVYYNKPSVKEKHGIIGTFAKYTSPRGKEIHIGVELTKKMGLQLFFDGRPDIYIHYVGETVIPIETVISEIKREMEYRFENKEITITKSGISRQPWGEENIPTPQYCTRPTENPEGKLNVYYTEPAVTGKVDKFAVYIAPNGKEYNVRVNISGDWLTIDVEGQGKHYGEADPTKDKTTTYIINRISALVKLVGLDGAENPEAVDQKTKEKWIQILAKYLEKNKLPTQTKVMRKARAIEFTLMDTSVDETSAWFRHKPTGNYIKIFADGRAEIPKKDEPYVMGFFDFNGSENPHQKLLTAEIKARMPKLYSQEKVKDPIVQVKFFSPWSNWEWYATEGEEQNGDYLMFGLVKGFETELGYFTLTQLESVKKGGMPLIERDMYWKPRPLSEVKKGFEGESNPVDPTQNTGETYHIKYFTDPDEGKLWAENNKVDMVDIYYDHDAGQYAVKYTGFPVLDDKHTSDEVVTEENPIRLPLVMRGIKDILEGKL